MPALLQIPDAPDAGVLSIALIGPSEQHRKTIGAALAWCHIGMEARGPQLLDSSDSGEGHGARRQHNHAGVNIREFASYPPNDLDDVPKALGRDYDLVIIELDTDPILALGMVKSICGLGLAAVMVYSAKPDLEMAIGSMRAGAASSSSCPSPPPKWPTLSPGSRSAASPPANPKAPAGSALSFSAQKAAAESPLLPPILP